MEQQPAKSSKEQWEAHIESLVQELDLDDMKGIAEQVPAMTADATERISRACAPLRIAQGSSALNARIDELVARRDSLA